MIFKSQNNPDRPKRTVPAEFLIIRYLRGFPPTLSPEVSRCAASSVPAKVFSLCESATEPFSELLTPGVVKRGVSPYRSRRVVGPYVCVCGCHARTTPERFTEAEDMAETRETRASVCRNTCLRLVPRSVGRSVSLMFRGVRSDSRRGDKVLRVRSGRRRFVALVAHEVRVKC